MRTQSVAPASVRGSLLGLFLAPLELGVLAWALGLGCAPALIQDYTLRRGELVYAVQQGEAYFIGVCQRTDEGELSNCQRYEVEFD